MTTHRRMIDNLCRQVLETEGPVTHTEDLLAAEVRRLQGENDRLRAEVEDRAAHEENLQQDIGSLNVALTGAAGWLTRLAEVGPDLRVNAHKKAKHEAEELASNPSLEEMSDVIICLVGVALHNGWPPDVVAAALDAKIEVNAARQWRQEPDGTWQHVAQVAQ